jgi:hypothetical protein
MSWQWQVVWCACRPKSALAGRKSLWSTLARDQQHTSAPPILQSISLREDGGLKHYIDRSITKTMDALSEFPDAPNAMDSALIQTLAAGGQSVARLEVTILDPEAGEDGPGIAFIDDTRPRTVSAPPYASLHGPPVFIPRPRNVSAPPRAPSWAAGPPLPLVFIPRPRTVSAPPRAPPWVAGPPPPLELDAEDAVAGENGLGPALESSTDGVQEDGVKQDDGLNQKDTVQENARHGDDEQQVDEWERKQIEARTKKTIQDIESIVRRCQRT